MKHLAVYASSPYKMRFVKIVTNKIIITIFSLRPATIFFI